MKQNVPVQYKDHVQRPSVYQYISTSVHQYISISVHQYINISVYLKTQVQNVISDIPTFPVERYGLLFRHPAQNPHHVRHK
jgi:hypothetical protein